MNLLKSFRPIETYFISQMFVFGLILLLPNNTFDNRAYEPMSLVAREEIWGIALILVSLFQLYSMIQKEKKLKIASLSITSFVWSGVATMFLISSIQSGIYSTGITYYVTSLFAFWLSYKIGGQKTQ
jgi:hypothetical protein